MKLKLITQPKTSSKRFIPEELDPSKFTYKTEVYFFGGKAPYARMVWPTSKTGQKGRIARLHITGEQAAEMLLGIYGGILPKAMKALAEQAEKSDPQKS